MKTLTEEDWNNIRATLSRNVHPFNHRFNTIEGIQQQIEEKEIGEHIYYAEQTAPIEEDENGKPKAQYDENGNPIPLVTIVQCQIIDQ